MDRRLASMLGLCQKAGMLVSGESLCENSIRARKAKLVIVCTDASDNAKKRLGDKSSFYGIPFYTSFIKDDLSRAIGRNNRAAVAVTDTGFAAKIKELLQCNTHSGS